MSKKKEKLEGVFRANDKGFGFVEFEDDELEDNGWQNDCWTYFSHYDYDFVLVLYYCGHTFELKLYRADSDD